MGITIDEAIKRYKSNAEYERTHGNLQGCLEFRQLAEWLKQYQELKADYETRLKADLRAILVELQLEIDEKAIRKQGIDSGFEYDYEFISSEEVIEVIQQKIDKLKAESEAADGERDNM